jgi:hypothetical protein
VLVPRRDAPDQERPDLTRSKGLAECHERDLITIRMLREGGQREVDEGRKPRFRRLAREVARKALPEQAVRLIVEPDEVVGRTELPEGRRPGFATRQAIRSLSMGERIGPLASHHDELHVSRANSEDRTQAVVLLDQEAERIGSHRKGASENRRSRDERRAERSGGNQGIRSFSGRSIA